jgi:hypothetical protein
MVTNEVIKIDTTLVFQNPHHISVNPTTSRYYIFSRPANQKRGITTGNKFNDKVGTTFHRKLAKDASLLKNFPVKIVRQMEFIKRVVKELFHIFLPVGNELHLLAQESILSVAICETNPVDVLKLASQPSRDNFETVFYMNDSDCSDMLFYLLRAHIIYLFSRLMVRGNPGRTVKQVNAAVAQRFTNSTINLLKWFTTGINSLWIKMQNEGRDMIRDDEKNWLTPKDKELDDLLKNGRDDVFSIPQYHHKDIYTTKEQKDVTATDKTNKVEDMSEEEIDAMLQKIRDERVKRGVLDQANLETEIDFNKIKDSTMIIGFIRVTVMIEGKTFSTRMDMTGKSEQPLSCMVCNVLMQEAAKGANEVSEIVESNKWTAIFNTTDDKATIVDVTDTLRSSLGKLDRPAPTRLHVVSFMATKTKGLKGGMIPRDSMYDCWTTESVMLHLPDGRRVTFNCNIARLPHVLSSKYGLSKDSYTLKRLWNCNYALHIKMKGGMEDDDSNKDLEKPIPPNNPPHNTEPPVNPDTQNERLKQHGASNYDISPEGKGKSALTERLRSWRVPESVLSVISSLIETSKTPGAKYLICESMAEDNVFQKAVELLSMLLGGEDQNVRLPSDVSPDAFARSLFNNSRAAKLSTGTGYAEVPMYAFTQKGVCNAYLYTTSVLGTPNTIFSLSYASQPAFKIVHSSLNDKATKKYTWSTENLALANEIQNAKLANPANVSRTQTTYWNQGLIIDMITSYYGTESWKGAGFADVLLKMMLGTAACMIHPDNASEIVGPGYYYTYESLNTLTPGGYFPLSVDTLDVDYTQAICMTFREFEGYSKSRIGSPAPGWEFDKIGEEITVVPVHLEHLSDGKLNAFITLAHLEYPYVTRYTSIDLREWSGTQHASVQAHYPHANLVNVDGPRQKVIYVIVEATQSNYFATGGQTVILNGTLIPSWDGVGVVLPADVNVQLTLTTNEMITLYPAGLDWWYNNYGAEEDYQLALRYFTAYTSVRRFNNYAVGNGVANRATLGSMPTAIENPTSYVRRAANGFSDEQTVTEMNAACWSGYGQVATMVDRLRANTARAHAELPYHSSIVAVSCAARVLRATNQCKLRFKNPNSLLHLTYEGGLAMHIMVDRILHTRRVAPTEFITNHTRPMRSAMCRDLCEVIGHAMQSFTSTTHELIYTGNYTHLNRVNAQPICEVLMFGTSTWVTAAEIPEILCRAYLEKDDCYKDYNLMDDLTQHELIRDSSNIDRIVYEPGTEELTMWDLGRWYNNIDAGVNRPRLIEVIESGASKEVQQYVDFNVWIPTSYMAYLNTINSLHNSVYVSRPVWLMGTKSLPYYHNGNWDADVNFYTKNYPSVRITSPFATSYNTKNRFVGFILRLRDTAANYTGLNLKNVIGPNIFGSGFRTLDV